MGGRYWGKWGSDETGTRGKRGKSERSFTTVYEGLVFRLERREKRLGGVEDVVPLRGVGEATKGPETPACSFTTGATGKR